MSILAAGLYGFTPTGMRAIFIIFQSTFFLYIYMLVYFFFWSIVVHICGSFFGAKSGFNATAASVAYGSTPLFLTGWLIGLSDFIGSLIIVWVLALQGIGMSGQHKMTPVGTALSVAIPFVIMLVLSVFAFNSMFAFAQ